jgi:hypothetical protein
MRIILELVRTWKEDRRTPFTTLGSRSLLKTKGKEEYFVLSEAYPLDTGHENMLFRGDKEGNVLSYSDLWCKHHISHSDALTILTNEDGVDLYAWEDEE